MRPRFVIGASRNGGPPPSLEACRAHLTPPVQTFAAAGVRALVQAGGAQLLGTNGLLLGILFKRDCRGAVHIGPADQAAAIASGGETLARHFWGAYVALLADPEGPDIHIVRAPLGDLPCYWTRVGDSVLVASDVALLTTAGACVPRVDYGALVRHLAAEDVRRPETCLEQVRELPGGMRLSLASGGIRSTALWSPWAFARPDQQIHDKMEAARRVRNAALHCVQARASQFGPVLLKLSGGLDSSIVAACLHAAGAEFRSLNLVTRDPSGDERDHARAVAKALCVDLFESVRQADQVNLELSAADALPRPTAHGFAQESARLAAAAANRAGSRALFDGGGGDNLFCSLRSARPVADCLLSADRRKHFWECARTVAELAQASIAQVVWRAFMISRRRSPSFRWQVDLRFLSCAARELAPGATDHPWLHAPTGTLPGKAAHVALIAGTQSVAEGFDAEAPLPSCSPLISQPLVEACLAVPSWQWFDRGYNRAIARRSFEGYLPERTVRRRSKGAPDCFIAELYESNRTLIRTMLMDGVLRGQGLLDVDALFQTLNSDAPVEGHDYLRIMQLVDAEAWARSWS